MSDQSVQEALDKADRVLSGEKPLEGQIKVVALNRSIAKSNADILRMQREKWEEENKEQIDLVANSKADVEDAEAVLRELTLQAYAETGNKTPAPGVSVKIFQVLDYDTTEALKYAREHGVALKLDTASFEKMIRIPELRPGFVSVTNEPRAQIAQNL